MLYRCQAILKHANGLPRDAVTNTFWFESASGAPSSTEAENAAERVRDWYVTDAGAAQNTALMNFLNNSLATTGHEVKVTPIDEATGIDERGLGFPPLHTEVFDFVSWARASETGLPNEVACCLSMKNSILGSVPPPRRRGRVYLGPLNIGGLVASGGVWRPSVGLQEDLIEASQKMLTDAAAQGLALVVYSRPYEGRGVVPRPGHPRGDLPAIAARSGEAYVVDSFWCDNAFDTQRRRGERPTARLLG
jgi:hypothetical protein